MTRYPIGARKPPRVPVLPWQKRNLRVRRKLHRRFIGPTARVAGLGHRRRPIAPVSFQGARADQGYVTGAQAGTSRVSSGAKRLDFLDVPMLSIVPGKWSRLRTAEACTIGRPVESKEWSFGLGSVGSRLGGADRTRSWLCDPPWSYGGRGGRDFCPRGGNRPRGDHWRKNQLKARIPGPFDNIETPAGLSHSDSLKYREDRCA